jgi:hypothetical protein
VRWSPTASISVVTATKPPEAPAAASAILAGPAA